MVWSLFYYNSLPDLPSECKMFDPEIIHRDFTWCNPKNTGHYQYPKFETLSYDCGCHEPQVKSLLKRKEDDKYVILYTRHTKNKYESSNKIVGYFKVGEIASFKWKTDSEHIGFKSSESLLLPKSKALDIDYKSRAVPVSWGNSKIKNYVNKVLNDFLSGTYDHLNIADNYQMETKKIMKSLCSEKGRLTMAESCHNCNHSNGCFLAKKIRKKKIEYLHDLYKDHLCSPEQAI
jgi:hypothetical protein